MKSHNVIFLNQLRIEILLKISDEHQKSLTTKICKYALLDWTQTSQDMNTSQDVVAAFRKKHEVSPCG